MYKDSKIQKFIHIPVQSGSNRILGSMRRGYEVKDFKKIVGAFRKEIPDITVSTDIIVGFPDENESDFELTVNLIKGIKPEKINISKFGRRSGTDASDMPGQIPYEAMRERSIRLHKLVMS